MINITAGKKNTGSGGGGYGYYCETDTLMIADSTELLDSSGEKDNNNNNNNNIQLCEIKEPFYKNKKEMTIIIVFVLFTLIIDYLFLQYCIR